jgi:hypothetical protein
MSKNVKGVRRLSNFWNSFVWLDPNNFLPRLVTMDETWLITINPETKRQPME